MLSLLVIFTLLFTTVGCVENDENSAPQATFSVIGSRGVGDELTFDASETTDADGDKLTYSWKFGDGAELAAQSGATAKHTYVEVGTYTVLLSVSDGRVASTHDIALTITIDGSGGTTDPVDDDNNTAPVAIISFPDGFPDLTSGPTVEVNLSGYTSYDNDLDDLGYAWDLDDSDGISYSSPDDAGVNVTGVFTDGVHEVGLKVEERFTEDGLIGEDTDYIVIDYDMTFTDEAGPSPPSIGGPNMSYTVPVREHISSFVVVLEFESSNTTFQINETVWNANDLDIILYNDSGARVANASEDSERFTALNQSKTLAFYGYDMLAMGDVGDWKVEVRWVSGAPLDMNMIPYTVNIFVGYSAPF